MLLKKEDVVIVSHWASKRTTHCCCYCVELSKRKVLLLSHTGLQKGQHIVVVIVLSFQKRRDVD